MKSFNENDKKSQYNAADARFLLHFAPILRLNSAGIT
jgi:hypothetical protein